MLTLTGVAKLFLPQGLFFNFSFRLQFLSYQSCQLTLSGSSKSSSHLTVGNVDKQK